MNLLKYMFYPSMLITSLFFIPVSFGKTAELPVFRTLAEPELRVEAGVIQYQQDPQQAQALQHKIMQIQLDTQNFVVDPTVLARLDLVPEGSMPNINSVPLALYSNRF